MEYSQDDLHYISRWITPSLQVALRDHPIVVLTGPRQVGKSTLLANAEPTRDLFYLTLDDLDVLAQANRDPAALLSGRKSIVIDEIQKAPKLLSEIKRAVDKSNRRMRVVLSGSANLLLMEKVSETLAGRAVFTTLDAMANMESKSQAPSVVLSNLFTGTWPEDGRADADDISVSEVVLRGFIPPVLHFSEVTSVIQWWEGYVSTFLERDLRTISRIESLPDFRRLMTALALRSGQIINQTDIARDLKLSQPTVHRYVNMLEMMCLLHRLPVYAVNQTKRLVKSPKFYWFDPGLACFLAGYYDQKTLLECREWGVVFLKQ